MELSERLTQLTQIQAARQTIEAQRPVLGDVIDATLADIDSRIASLLPPAPTEEQLKTASGWNTVLEQLAELDMPLPEPNETVLDAVRAVSEYAHVTEVFQSLGAVSLGSTEVAPSPTESTPSESSPKRPRQRSRRASTVAPKPELADAAPEEQPVAEPIIEQVQEPVAEQDTPIASSEIPVEEVPLPETIGKVVISDGNHEKEITRIHKEFTVAILKALQESPDGTVETTALHRQLVGASSREIEMHRNGTRLIDDLAFDATRAKLLSRHFYFALKELSGAHYVEHIPGSLGAGSGVNRNKSGLIKAHSDIQIIANEQGDVRVEMNPTPHQVRVNLYDQSIANGHGQAHVFEKDSRKFEKIARTIGFLATKSESETARFTRTKLQEWLPDVMGPDRHSMQAVSSDLKSVAETFNDDFPLLQRGTRGGAYFTWDSRAEVEVVDGFPEKPNFENAIQIRIAEGTVYVVVDGTEQPLIEYTDNLPALKTGVVGADTLIKRQSALFMALSAIEATDVIDAEQLRSLMPTEDISVNALSNWIYSVTDKLNELAGEIIVNRRRFGSMLIDLNRRIVVVDSDQELSADDNANSADPLDGTPKEPIDDEPAAFPLPEGAAEDPSEPEEALPENPGVAPRRTALELIEDTNNLDERTKMILRRRLTQDGRFEFPKKLEHAVYLLQLVADNSALAELRETDRFRHSDASYYENFIAELLCACYFRTMTWGEFGSLVQAVRQTAPDSVTISSDNFLHTAMNTAFNESAVTPHDTAHRATERAKLDIYLAKALDDFRHGIVPPVATPMQAVGLLDHFRANRQVIAEGKTQHEFDQLVESLQVSCYDVLGKGNLLSMLDFRTPARTTGGQRAIQTATGEEQQLTRTDSYRYPDIQPRGRRRRRP